MHVGESFCGANGNVYALEQCDRLWISAVEHVVEASLCDELEDQHGNVCLKAAPNEAHHVCMSDSELEGDLVDELLLRKCFSFHRGTLNCDPLAAFLNDPYVHLAEGAFSYGFFCSRL